MFLISCRMIRSYSALAGGTTFSAQTTEKRLTTKPAARIGAAMRRKLSPPLRMAVISLLPDSCPIVSREASSMDMGKV